MENDSRKTVDDSDQQTSLEKNETTIAPASNLIFAKPIGNISSDIAKLPILQLGLVLVFLLCLAFILGKFINQYDLTSICAGWTCNIIQNPDNCSTKHIVSLATGGTFGLVAGVGASLIIPAGAVVAPAIAGLLLGASVFGGSSILLELLLPC